tara:strand:- start:1118 stop:2164 length:1047 start_codon:yes stop_codon:yes gene_type:complete
MDYQNKIQKVRFIDLFSGIGGFHSAITKVLPGSECVLASDIDDKARQTYLNNYDIMPHGDIKDLDIANIPKHDVLCAGFPCQAFSIAQWKKAKGFNDERGMLFFELMKIVRHHKPRMLFLENVANLVRMEKGSVFKCILDELQSQGYSVSWEILSPRQFGIPQNRERVYIVCHLPKENIKEFDFTDLKERKIQCTLQKILEDSDSIPEESWIDATKYTLLDAQHLKTQPKSGLIFRGYINAPLRKKGTKPNTSHLSRVHKQPMRIYSSDGTHPTLSSSETSGRYRIYDEKQKKVRCLTLNECYALMGFDKSFIKHDKKGTAYKQIGNSVCIGVLEAILHEVLKQGILE